MDVAHDGVDGLHLAREQEYDLIVLDIMLPGLNGYRSAPRSGTTATTRPS